MFYATDKRDHGLPHDPFKAIVAPRPIGWISSASRNGEINLAPYSFFNAVSTRPPIVCFSSEGRKDSLAFVEETALVRRIGQPEDIAAAVVYLSSPAGDFVTGKIFEIDGGAERPQVDLGPPA